MAPISILLQSGALASILYVDVEKMDLFFPLYLGMLRNPCGSKTAHPRVQDCENAARIPHSPLLGCPVSNQR